MTAQFSVRMDDKLKEDFSNVLENMGLNISTVVTMLAKQVVQQRKLPFEVKDNSMLEPKLQRAMIEDMAIEAGIIPDNRKRYDSVEEMFADLDKEFENE